MPKLLIKSKGLEYTCLFDKRDKKLVSRYRWSLSHGYAVTSIKGKTVYFHRLIMGIVDRPDVEADHRNHNRLDNRRANLRACTRAENRRNARGLPGTSQFKGVYRDLNQWHSQIGHEGRVFNLGRFRSEITAGKVYDKAAKELFQDFAFLNFSEPLEEFEQMTIPGFND